MIDWRIIELNKKTVNIMAIASVMTLTLVSLTGCGSSLTNKEKSKFYQAKDFLESSSKDEGTKYDDVVATRSLSSSE